MNMNMNMNTPTLETSRLILRQFIQADVEDVFVILSDREVNHFLPMFPLESVEQARQYLETSYLESYKKQVGHRYAVCLKEDNKPIGYVCLSEGDSRDLGYALKKEHWGKGIITEAAAAVISQLKAQGYTYVTATHDIYNPGSGAVMKKIGMTYKYSYVEQVQPKNTIVTFRMYQLNLDGVDDRVYTEYWDKYPNHFIEKDI